MIPSFTKDGKSPEDLRFRNDASTPNQLTESPPAASPAISIVSDATTATEYSNGGGVFSPQTQYIYDGGASSSFVLTAARSTSNVFGSGLTRANSNSSVIGSAVRTIFRQDTPISPALWPFPLRNTDSLDLFTCPICFEDKPKNLTHTVQGCQHTQCKSCLVRWFENSINNGQYILCCPHVGDEACNMPLSRPEVESLLTTEMLAKLDRFETLSENNQRECPFCGHMQMGDPEMPMMTCPSCGKEHCFVHSAAHNSSMTCEEYEQKHHKEFSDNLRAAMEDKAMECPGCKIIVSKTEGCNHMTCAKCKVEFCYLCGVDITGKVDEHFSRGVCNQFDHNPYADLDPFAFLPGREHSCFAKFLAYFSIFYTGLLFVPLYIAAGSIALWIFLAGNAIFREWPDNCRQFRLGWWIISQYVLFGILFLGIGLPLLIVGLVLGMCLSMCCPDFLPCAPRFAVDNICEFAFTFVGFCCGLVWLCYMLPLLIIIYGSIAVAKLFFPDSIPDDIDEIFEPAAGAFAPAFDDY